MPLNASGPISLAGSTAGQSISNEFRSLTTSTASLSQYYRGGTYVGPHNGPVAASGAISLGSFYNASKRFTTSITYSASTSNVNIQTSSVSGYSSGWTDLTINVNSGVTISSSGGNSSLTITGFVSADTVHINNSGTIQGAGGGGGSPNGGAGNHAINLAPASYSNIRVTNNSGGIIAGGGGGGGQGQAVIGYNYDSYRTTITGTTAYRGGGGGGGSGGGTSYGGGGPLGGAGNNNFYNYLSTGSAGGNGSTTAGGAGGIGDYGYTYLVNNYYIGSGGQGGAGGARGASGSSGSQGYWNGPSGVVYAPTNGNSSGWYPDTNGYIQQQSGYPLGSGGAAGYAIIGTSKLSQSVTNNGTIYGPQG